MPSLRAEDSLTAASLLQAAGTSGLAVLADGPAGCAAATGQALREDG